MRAYSGRRKAPVAGRPVAMHARELPDGIQPARHCVAVGVQGGARHCLENETTMSELTGLV